MSDFEKKSGFRADWFDATNWDFSLRELIICRLLTRVLEVRQSWVGVLSAYSRFICWAKCITF